MLEANDSSNFEKHLDNHERKRIQESVKLLSKLNPLKTYSTIIFNWLVIISISVISIRLDSIIFSILCIFIIASRQHALLLIMHEAAHYRIHKNKKINNLISDIFCSFPLFVTTQKYRLSHLAHHKYLNSEQDPDWMLRKNLDEWKFPKSKQEIVKIFISHLLGLRTLQLLSKIYRFGAKNKTVKDESKSSRTFVFYRLLFYTVLVFILTFFKLWLIYFIYWIIPAFTFLPFLLRLRSISEHFGLPWKNELNNSRNVETNLFERLFIIPNSGNFHLDHHLYPSVPFYNLKKLNQVLLKNDYYRINAYISKGYLSHHKNSVFNNIAEK
jgi:fatty acid desaturase